MDFYLLFVDKDSFLLQVGLPLLGKHKTERGLAGAVDITITVIPTDSRCH